MLDRALESVSDPYKLAIRILFFLMSSVAQLEAQIYIERGGIFKKNYKPRFFEISKNSLKIKNCIL